MDFFHLSGHRREPFEESEPATNLTTNRIQTGDALPIALQPYQLPMNRKIRVQQELHHMQAAGVIKPWAVPLVVIPMANEELRLCVDYRKLNAVTTNDRYTTPRIDQLLFRTDKRHYVSLLGLRQGFSQVPMAEEGMDKTAFTHLSLSEARPPGRRQTYSSTRRAARLRKCAADREKRSPSMLKKARTQMMLSHFDRRDAVSDYAVFSEDAAASVSKDFPAGEPEESEEVEEDNARKAKRKDPDWEPAVSPSKRIQKPDKHDLIDDNLLVILDKTNTSLPAAAAIINAFTGRMNAVDLSVAPTEINVNRSTLQKKRAYIDSSGSDPKVSKISGQGDTECGRKADAGSGREEDRRTAG